MGEAAQRGGEAGEVAVGAAACAEPSTYLSWDGIHMTQAAYRAMSRLVYHGKYLQPQILSFPEKYGQT